MTKEEIRDAFKPQVVETLNKEKLNLRIKMAAMRIQLDTIKQESTEIEHQQREWKEFYKQLRYDWQALNPIERLEDDDNV